MGSFMMQDKRVETYGLTPIKAARSKLTKGLLTSQYRSLFTVGGYQKKLELLVSDARAIPGQLEALIAESRLEFSKRAKPGRPKSAPTNPYPVKKTKVATRTEEYRVPKLTNSRTGWCEGVVIEYNPDHNHPYRIEWKDDPKVYENCNLNEMHLLTHHYKECDKRRLLDMECVGTEILWLRPIPKQPRGGDLLCGTVMFYDETLEKFKLLYRSGQDEWVTGYQIDDNLDHQEGYNLQERVAAVGEPWHKDAQRKIKSYGEYCVRDVGARKWGPTQPQIPRPTSKLSLLLATIKGNLPPPPGIPPPIVKSMTRYVMSQSSSTLITVPDGLTSDLPSTSITEPKPPESLPGGKTSNTPPTDVILGPLVMASSSNFPAAVTSLPEASSSSVTVATSITGPNPSVSVPAATSVTALSNVTATAMALKSNVTTLSAAMTVPDPSKNSTGETTTLAPTPLADLGPVGIAANNRDPRPSQEATALHLELVKTKLKLNVALLQKKLQAEKERQKKMVQPGNIVDQLHPPIIKIWDHEAKAPGQV